MIVFLFNGHKQQKLTAGLITAMVVPTSLDPSKWQVAITIAKTLEVPVYDVIGLRDTDEKILACHLELALNGDLPAWRVAKKYNINPNYMKKRIDELPGRMKLEKDLRYKVSLLRSGFHVEETAPVPV